MSDDAEEKTLNEVYSQRADIFMLAMAFARQLGYEVGTRGDDDEWPVHVIVLPAGIGEVALHVSAKDAEAVLLEKKNRTTQKYDGHTDEEKHERIREFVRVIFSFSKKKE